MGWYAHGHVYDIENMHTGEGEDGGRGRTAEGRTHATKQRQSSVCRRHTTQHKHTHTKHGGAGGGESKALMQPCVHQRTPDHNDAMGSTAYNAVAPVSSKNFT